MHSGADAATLESRFRVPGLICPHCGRDNITHLGAFSGHVKTCPKNPERQPMRRPASPKKDADRRPKAKPTEPASTKRHSALAGIINELKEDELSGLLREAAAEAELTRGSMSNVRQWGVVKTILHVVSWCGQILCLLAMAQSLWQAGQGKVSQEKVVRAYGLVQRMDLYLDRLRSLMMEENRA